MNNNENQSSFGFTLTFRKQQGRSVYFGMIDNNPNAPYNPNNNIKLYDSKERYNHIPSVKAIVCYINCDGFISNDTNNNTKQSTIDSNPIFSNIESTSNNSTNQPFSYQDSHTTAKEIINNDNTSNLLIESSKLESKRESIASIESTKLESKKINNTKNKNKVRLDSNGDEIMYEIKPKYYFLNTLTHIIILVLCVILLCVGVFTDIFTALLVKIVWSIFFGFTIYHIYDTLFGMVCFYITNSGIGFERRKLFRIQKKNFKFGEVEVSIGEYQVFVLYNHNEIFIAPLNAKGWYRRKNTYRLHFLNFFLSDDKKIYEIWDFIRKKSKIALQSKSIDTHSINLNTLFICFIKE